MRAYRHEYGGGAHVSSVHCLLNCLFRYFLMICGLITILLRYKYFWLLQLVFLIAISAILRIVYICRVAQIAIFATSMSLGLLILPQVLSLGLQSMIMIGRFRCCRAASIVFVICCACFDWGLALLFVCSLHFGNGPTHAPTRRRQCRRICVFASFCDLDCLVTGASFPPAAHLL
jgi:hypothetical protein